MYQRRINDGFERQPNICTLAFFRVLLFLFLLSPYISYKTFYFGLLFYVIYIYIVDLFQSNPIRKKNSISLMFAYIYKHNTYTLEDRMKKKIK